MTQEGNEIEMTSPDQEAETSTREISEQSPKEDPSKPSDKVPQKSSEGRKKQSGCRWLLGKVFYSFIALYTGYRTYFKYEVALAGLGLSFLYMTVLGFDNITIGKGFLQ